MNRQKDLLAIRETIELIKLEQKMNRWKDIIKVRIGSKAFTVQSAHRTCPCGVEFTVRKQDVARGRGKYCSTSCANHYRHICQDGVHNSRAKLSLRQVKSIRKLKDSGISQAELARKFSVSESNIWAICSGQSWKIEDSYERRCNQSAELVDSRQDNRLGASGNQ